MSIAGLLLVAIYAVALVAAEAPPRQPMQPSLDSAEANAHLIFNAVHSAGRQWGSSLNHNGFGFFSAVMPEGTLLYHGTRRTEPPPGPEWLAFEVEHSEGFAASFRWDSDHPPPRGGPAPPRKPGKGHGDDGADAVGGSQKPLGNQEASTPEDGDGDAPNDRGNIRGYLHTYRASRDLNLLYVDGMGAGKSSMGTLDSQDYVLREDYSGGTVFSEWDRAVEICDIITEWGYDGLVRMEIGFEIIYCDFTDGVDLVSRMRTFVPEDTEIGRKPIISFETQLFHWARAVGQRFDGLGADRLRIDFSSMVSGFFFPINISSTDPERPDLIRLGAATQEELKDLKTYLHGVSAQPRRFSVNWQGVVDMIVTRYSDRFALMGSDIVVDDAFINEVQRATLTYFDAPPLPDDIESEGVDGGNRTAEAMTRCKEHYLLPILSSKDQWTFEDELIYTAIDTVLHGLCHSLYSMRTLLVEASPDPDTNGYYIDIANGGDGLAAALNSSRAIAGELLEELAWTDWKKTRPCPVDEVLFVAMWPFGEEEDHWNPGCRSAEDMQGSRRSSYWGMGRMPPPKNDTKGV